MMPDDPGGCALHMSHAPSDILEAHVIADASELLNMQKMDGCTQCSAL